MNIHTMNHIVLLSHNDLDGHGSEIVLKSIGIKPFVKNLENKQVDSYINNYVSDILNGNEQAPDLLLITDISPKAEAAKKLDELHRSNKTKVFLFDHHVHAIDLNKYDWATVVVEEDGVKRCGTSLFYRFLINELDAEIPDYVQLGLDTFVREVELYDTWSWEEKNHVSAKRLNDLFWLIGPKQFVKSQVKKINNGLDTLFTSDEEQLLLVEKNRIDKYIHDKAKEMVVINDFFKDENGKYLTAGVVQSDMYVSELGHYLCDNYEIDFALMLNLTRNKASLRSVKEHIDLVPIATAYNGGGHRKAAGCEVTPLGMNFLGKVFKKLDKEENRY